MSSADNPGRGGIQDESAAQLGSTRQPPSESKRRAMQSQRERNTAPELALRRELHRRGLRYFVHRRPVRGLRREADIVFVRAKLAVFVDGCFWHGCPDHGTHPKNNAGWWQAKLNKNRQRDADTGERFRGGGWEVLRLWEHEAVDEAADRVEAAVRQRTVETGVAPPVTPPR